MPRAGARSRTVGPGAPVSAAARLGPRGRRSSSCTHDDRRRPAFVSRATSGAASAGSGRRAGRGRRRSARDAGRRRLAASSCAMSCPPRGVPRTAEGRGPARRRLALADLLVRGVSGLRRRPLHGLPRRPRHACTYDPSSRASRARDAPGARDGRGRSTPARSQALPLPSDGAAHDLFTLGEDGLVAHHGSLRPPSAVDGGRRGSPRGPRHARAGMNGAELGAPAARARPDRRPRGAEPDREPLARGARGGRRAARGGLPRRGSAARRPPTWSA